jgi:hypothetical protein
MAAQALERSHGHRGQGDAADGPGDRVRRVVHPGVDARIGHERRDDRERYPRRGPSGTDVRREGQRGRGMAGGPRRRAMHRHLARERNLVRVAVRPAPGAERPECQVQNSRDERDRRQAVLSGAAAAPSAERRKQSGAPKPEPRVVGGTRKTPNDHLHRGSGRRRDRCVDGHVEPVHLVRRAIEFSRSAAAGLLPRRGVLAVGRSR